jgi:hypothetical protein
LHLTGLALVASFLRNSSPGKSVEDIGQHTRNESPEAEATYKSPHRQRNSAPWVFSSNVLFT